MTESLQRKPPPPANLPAPHPAAKGVVRGGFFRNDLETGGVHARDDGRPAGHRAGTEHGGMTAT
jgi:hypothetical protein